MLPVPLVSVIGPDIAVPLWVTTQRTLMDGRPPGLDRVPTHVPDNAVLDGCVSGDLDPPPPHAQSPARNTADNITLITFRMTCLLPHSGTTTTRTLIRPRPLLNTSR